MCVCLCLLLFVCLVVPSIVCLFVFLFYVLVLPVLTINVVRGHDTNCTE